MVRPPSNIKSIAVVFAIYTIDIVYISLEDAASTVEGRPANIRLTLNIANGGELECGGIWVGYSRSDVITSKPMQSPFHCEKCVWTLYC